MGAERGAGAGPERHPRGRLTSAAARRQAGLSLLELVATCTLMLILASAVLPLAKVAIKRQKEIELRRALRELRLAIDKYNEAIVSVPPRICGPDVKADNQGYPPDLETLVEGVADCTAGGLRKIKFLRRIPKDPMTNSTEWGMRCYQDDADADSWCGNNVWDVYTTSGHKGLDDTPYREW